MSGTVTGGWEFVIAAYGITIFVVGFYTVRAILGYRAALRKIGSPTSGETS
jgi:hypothetical protein